MLLHDLRYAVRTLARAPGFTVAVVLTLALGSGANAAIFSVFNQTLLRSLPVPTPERLVNLSSPGPKTGRTSTNGTDRGEDVFSYPLFRDLDGAQNAFTGIAAHAHFAANLACRGQASSESGRLVSGSYFDVLELLPAAGRLIVPADDLPGANDVAVLSYQYWTSRLNKDPSVINETIIVNGRPMTLIGVTPRSWSGTTLEEDPKVYVPLTAASEMIPGWNGFANRRDHWLDLFARLRPGISREAAERAMAGPFAAILKDLDLPAQQSGLADRDRQLFAQRRLIVEPGKQGQRPERAELQSVFALLFSVTAVVLLIACANVAGLLLARMAARATDVSVRVSLGASRWQLVRQLLFETSLLAGIGTAGGLLVALWIIGASTSVFPAGVMGEYFRFTFDRSFLLFAVMLSSSIVLLVGVYPAIHATRHEVVSTLRSSTTTSGTRGATRFRTLLATAQIAMSMALLVVAGLFTQSLFNVSRLELGIKSEHLFTFRLSPELNGYTPARARAFGDRIEQELAALPGVESVSASTIALLGGSAGGSNITVNADGTLVASERGVMRARVGQRYFETVGIPLVAGREFGVSDDLAAPKVAIVNEAFARTFMRGMNPVGARLAEGRGNKIQLDVEIVGVVRDARYAQIKDPPPPQYYLPYRQIERPGSLNFYVRSAQEPRQLLSMIPATVRRVDGTLPVENLRTMDDQLKSTQGLDRFVTLLSLCFAALATTLAAVGMYGVLAFSVAQRRREIGLRMALGADGRRISQLVLSRVAWMTIAGIALGSMAATGLARLARAELFGVPGLPPVLLVSAAICTVVVAFGAATIPAWRAVRVEPAPALRSE
jgi:predicted permease